jgi:translocation and assembly module TamB
VQAALSDDFGTLTIRRLALTSPEIKGRAEANGVVHLDAQPLGAELALAWNGVELPPEIAGQTLASDGKLDVRGSAERFHAQGDVALGPPGKPSQLALDIDGGTREIAIHTLALKQPRGGAQAQGTLTLDPSIAWQLEITGDGFDPGQFAAGWDGALDFDVASEGKLPRDGADATLDLRKLDGTLRQRKVHGGGKLHISADEVVDGHLDLASGGSTLIIDGKPGTSNDATIKLAIASLGDWLPDAGGRLNGYFNLRGKWPKLAVQGQLHGNALAWQDRRAETLSLDLDLPDLSQPGGRAQLRAGKLDAGGLAFDSVDLDAHGTEARHDLKLDARGQQLNAALALSGSLKGDDWSGTLSQLDLEPDGLPRWRLQRDAAMRYTQGAFALSELCVDAGDPSLCLSATQDAKGNFDADYRLHALPVALLLAAGAADLPMRADGSVEGQGKLHRDAGGALHGQATLRSADGSVTYTDHPERPLLAWKDFNLVADLDGTTQRAEVHAGLGDNGRLDGQISLAGDRHALDGNIEMHLDSVAFAELLTDELANVKGTLDARFALGGDLEKPALRGQATLDGFAAEVPGAGLKLSDGHVSAVTTDAQSFKLDGSIKSGDGTLAIGGTAGIDATTPTDISLKGDKFLAADIPAAKVTVSPDLAIKRDATGLNVGGSAKIDSADVDVSKLPGAGATQASPDVVVVDQPQQSAAASAPISALVKIDLGHRTHLKGMGLDGKLGGVLTVRQRPGKAPTGQGQISVDGTYRAYGQDLHIQKGQLLFASTPLDNPGLDIRAVRSLRPNATIDEGQQVGLYVSGTAQRPVLTVFSNPVMEQSDALSYLVTGKPLSQVKGGEGNMVGAAAQALGSAAGDLLAKGIGSRLGIDAGVSSNEALGGGAAFTVGKYLSPRLYLSYGVGLFDPGTVITLRYILSHRWNFEAEQATEFSRASFNYRYEK